MDDLAWMQDVGWAAAVAIAGVAVLYIARRRAKAQDAEQAINVERRAIYEREERALLDALAHNDAQSVAVQRERVDRLRKKGWHLLALAACLVPFAGCSAPRMAVAVPVGTYATVVEPGAVVPPLPDGELRWWLMSAPTGVGMMMPADSPLNLGMEGDAK